MSSEDEGLSACHCCEGVQILTPAEHPNRPGLAALAYRIGTHGTFKATMQARISSMPALRALGTRDNGDFTIALLDAWATVADVLSFYTERVANEGLLRTATEFRSVQEHARSIGDEPDPGVLPARGLPLPSRTAPARRRTYRFLPARERKIFRRGTNYPKHSRRLRIWWRIPSGTRCGPDRPSRSSSIATRAFSISRGQTPG